MNAFPTFFRLPIQERRILAISLAFAFGVVAYFSFFATPERLFALEKLIGVGALVLCIGATGHAVFRIFQTHGGEEGVAVWLGRCVRSHRALFAVWIICSFIALSLFPTGNRVLMDEIVVLCTSRAIHEEKEPVTPTMMESLDGVHKLTQAYIDKRPYLYATILAGVHDLVGYSPDNAFYLNMALGAVSIGLFGVLGYRLGRSEYAGAIAMLSVTSIPIFCQQVTGGGIDLINIFSMLVLLCATIEYLERPSGWTLRAMWGGAVLLAYSRYESLLYFVVPIVALIFLVRNRGRVWVDSSVLLLWPSIVPLLGIHYLTFSKSDHWFQLADQGVQDAFSLAFIRGNLAHAVAFFCDTEHLLTNSLVVFIAGAVAFLLLVVALVRRPFSLGLASTMLPFWTFTLVNLLSFMLLMAYSWGRLDDIVASRLSLPLYVLFVLSIATVLVEISDRRFRVLYGFLFAGGLYWSCFPLAAKNYAHKMYSTAQTLELLDEFQRAQPDRRFAVLNNITNFWITRDVYSVPPSSLRSNPDFLNRLLTRSEFRRVYLIQVSRLEPKTGKFIVDKGDVFGVNAAKRLISEDLITGDRKVQVWLLERQRDSTADDRIQVGEKNSEPTTTLAGHPAAR